MDKTFRIVFIGVKDVGYQALKILLKRKVDIVAVITMPGEDNAKIRALAVKTKIALFENPNTKLEFFLDEIKKLNPQRGLVFSYPRILSEVFLDIFEKGCLNFHPAKLPEYRGCYPTVWPILYGDKFAYCTIHYVVKDVDAGDIIDQFKIKIQKEDIGYSLYQKVVQKILDILEKKAIVLCSKDFHGRKQNNATAKYYPKALPNDGQIDWSKDRLYISRFIKALKHPKFIGAYTVIGGRMIEPIEVKTIKGQKGKDLYFINRGQLYFRASDGLLEIKKIRIDSGKIIGSKIGTYFQDELKLN